MTDERIAFYAELRVLVDPRIRLQVGPLDVVARRSVGTKRLRYAVRTDIMPMWWMAETINEELLAPLTGEV